MTDTAVSQASGKMPLWLSCTVIGAVAVVVLVVGYLVASVTLPVVWANSIRDQLGGRPANSVPLGMFYGFTFSFVPILLLWQCRRRKLAQWARIALVAAAVLLLVPTLLTLGVMYGGSQLAVDARVIWVTSANWFGTWSQIFMVLGVVCAVAIIVLGRMFLRRRQVTREQKTALK